MFELSIAFGAGLISFLSPCVLPLIPGYISFISGSSLNELLEKKKINLIPLILFSMGFSFVFILFGAAASFLGQILLENSQTLRVIAGLIIIVFSLQLIGIINISFLNFVYLQSHQLLPNMALKVQMYHQIFLLPIVHPYFFANHVHLYRYKYSNQKYNLEHLLP